MASTPTTDPRRAAPARRFSTLLVANRGEIALRIIRAAREVGLATVAVYSDADRGAAHTRAADVAVRIGPPTASASYLSIEALLDAAQRTGADAVHPGYGFLSESATFARAVAREGLVFVGPPPDVIDLMGRKDRARVAATKAGLVVTPAVEGDDVETLVARATSEVGLPLLVKAAAGGGGKGMRIVRDAATLREAVESARRESAAAFGDDSVFIERYVEHGRHIEVQVLGDEYGNVVHLYERDCSVQRRHQKVIEEAPAPTISSALGHRVRSAAVALARAVGYVNAGTMEFLVEGDDSYFLEMNTRLQVEHPVTELITRRDLVALQLAIAQGERLPFTQEDLVPVGHAIEARVYAEDPNSGFLPQAGSVTAVTWPTRARVDAALEAGQIVGTWYDPMLGKVIVHGPTREAARRELVAALDETVIVGVTSNLSFLRRLVASGEFRDRELDTAWLDNHPGAYCGDAPIVVACAAAWVTATNYFGADPADPFNTGEGWRLRGTEAPVQIDLDLDAATLTVDVDLTTQTVSSAQWRREIRPVELGPRDAGRLVSLTLEIDGRIERLALLRGPKGLFVGYQGATYLSKSRARRPTTLTEASGGRVDAPMPGTVIAVAATIGAPVKRDDVLGVMEAMKMEYTLRAPIDGVVSAVHVEVGDNLAVGAAMFAVDGEDD
ncbi:MAG TPA: biotin carboxylase N-terminal domain-containing protein [Acidimicrobiales bacterium]|nr:biotin carboxylase N-terminal domain-containing protein [Acidimicrobiales bacterium]